MRIEVLYFASMRERAGCDAETVDTAAATAAALYDELRARHGFPFDAAALRVAVDGDFADWNAPLAGAREIAFVPPVSGG